MTVDKKKVENILKSDDFHFNEVIDLVEERGLKVKKRRKEEMIEALLAAKWSDDEFAELKDRFARIKKERSPLGYYIAKVSDYPNLTPQPRYEELKEKLLVEEAEREGADLLEDGFEIRAADPKKVAGIYWTQTQTYDLDALRNLRSTERVYDIGFEFDLGTDILHINADNYGKRGEILNKFKNTGVDIESIGYETLSKAKANDIVRGFVDDVESGLKDSRKQKDLSDYGTGTSPDLFSVDTIEIKILDGELKTANLEGHEDIFKNETVEKLINEKEGRIIHLRGVMTYGDDDYDFHVGLPENFGRVRIQRKGGPTGNVKSLEETFDFLFECFRNNFIQ